MKSEIEIYNVAQETILKLKVTVLLIVSEADEGIKNIDISKKMGIHHFTVGDSHTDYISRYMLEQLSLEGLVRQDPGSKKWFLANNT